MHSFLKTLPTYLALLDFLIIMNLGSLVNNISSSVVGHLIITAEAAAGSAYLTYFTIYQTSGDVEAGLVSATGSVLLGAAAGIAARSARYASNSFYQRETAASVDQYLRSLEKVA